MKLPHQMRRGSRYARETGAGRTLGEMVSAKMALVAVCRRCKHRRVLYPANLVARHGEHFPAIELRPHAGSRRATTMWSREWVHGSARRQGTLGTTRPAQAGATVVLDLQRRAYPCAPCISSSRTRPPSIPTSEGPCRVCDRISAARLRHRGPRGKLPLGDVGPSLGAGVELGLKARQGAARAMGRVVAWPRR
jgi:hypothetical protein